MRSFRVLIHLTFCGKSHSEFDFIYGENFDKAVENYRVTEEGWRVEKIKFLEERKTVLTKERIKQLIY